MAVSGRSIWSTLGIRATTDGREIRRAYAVRLKVTHPEEDAEGFQALRAAYEQAMAMADRAARAQAEAETHDDALPDPQSTAPVEEARPAALANAPIEEAMATPVQVEPAQPVDLAFVDADRDHHQRVCDALRELVQQEGPPPTDEAAVAALNAVLNSPAMDSVRTHEWTEGFLAWLIAEHTPNSDALVAPVIRQFGWSDNRLGGKVALSDVVLRRQALLVEFHELARPLHPFAEALRTLSNPPRPLKVLRNRFALGLDEQVRKLLDQVRAQQLIHRFDPEAIAWWEAYFAQPRLGPVAMWMIAATPIVCIPILLAPAPMGFEAYGLILAVVWGTTLGWFHAVVRTRARLGDRIQAAPAWVRLGWGPLALAIMALTAAPANAVVSSVAALLGLGAVGWAVITGERDRFEGPNSRSDFVKHAAPLVLPLAFCAVCLWDASVATVLQVAIGALTGGLVWLAAARSLSNLWLACSSAQRSLVLATALAAVGLSPFLLWYAGSGQAWVAPAMVLVCVNFLVQQVVANRIQPKWARWRRSLWTFGVGFWWLWEGVSEDAVPQGNATLFFGGVWLMCGVLIGLIAALRGERLAATAPALA